MNASSDRLMSAGRSRGGSVVIQRTAAGDPDISGEFSADNVQRAVHTLTNGANGAFFKRSRV